MKYVAAALSFTLVSGAWASGGFALTKAKSVTTTSNALATFEKQATPVSKTGNTLRYAIKRVRLVVRTGPENDMMSYRIKGLRNPTISVPASSVLAVLFINSDEDMTHNFKVTGANPPFKAVVGGVGSADIQHEKGGTYSGQELLLKAPLKPGTYRYVCSVAGHAAAGMYGTLVVR